MATWTGSRRIPNGGWIRACCGPACARSSCSASITAPMKIRSRCSSKRTRGAISAYAQGDDYHDVIKKRLKALARWLVAASGEEVKVFVDTAAVMEKPLAQAAGLGWQGKHTNLVSREFGSWLFLGAIFTASDLPRDEADARSLRLLQRLPGDLPDRGIPRALQARCAALHFLSHDREQGPDPARVSQEHRQPHLWLRRLPRGVPVEQVRAGRPRSETCRARGIARAAACGPGAARRCRVPRAVHEIAGQAHRPRPLHPQRADRDRQRRRRVAGAGGRALARRCKPAGARRGGMGAVAIDGAREVRGAGRRRRCRDG